MDRRRETRMGTLGPAASHRSGFRVLERGRATGSSRGRSREGRPARDRLSAKVQRPQETAPGNASPDDLRLNPLQRLDGFDQNLIRRWDAPIASRIPTFVWNPLFPSRCWGCKAGCCLEWRTRQLPLDVDAAKRNPQAMLVHCNHFNLLGRAAIAAFADADLP